MTYGSHSLNLSSRMWFITVTISVSESLIWRRSVGSQEIQVDQIGHHCITSRRTSYVLPLPSFFHIFHHRLTCSQTTRLYWRKDVDGDYSCLWCWWCGCDVGDDAGADLLTHRCWWWWCCWLCFRWSRHHSMATTCKFSLQNVILHRMPRGILSITQRPRSPWIGQRSLGVDAHVFFHDACIC